jgi:predicted nucleic acid-binding protein
MIVVVADTSPIHYLIQIRVVEVLSKLFDQVLIPVTVERELLDSFSSTRCTAVAAQSPEFGRCSKRPRDSIRLPFFVNYFS